MKMINKITGVVLKGFLSLLSVILLLSILALIAAQGFVVWLNTNSGGNWLGTQIEQTLQNTPYQIQLNNFTLSGITSLKIGTVTLQDPQGHFAELKNVGLSANPFPLVLKRLSIDLFADEVTLLRTPKAASDRTEDTSQSGEIILPDLLFSSIKLDLNITQLALGQDVISGGFKTRLRLSQTLTLQDESARLSGTTSLDQIQSDYSKFIFQTITNTFVFDESAQKIEIKNVLLKKDKSQAQLSGSYNLIDNNIIADLNATLHQTDITDNAELKSPIEIQANLSGKASDFYGHINAATDYQSFPLNLATSIAFQDNLLSLQKIQGVSDDVTLSGDVNYDIAANLFDGKLNANITALENLGQLAGIHSLRGNGQINLTFQAYDGIQALNANALLNNIGYQDTQLQSLNAKATIQDITNWQSTEAVISLQALKHGKIIIENANITAGLKETEGRSYTALKISGKGFEGQPFTFSGQGNIYEFAPLELDLGKTTVTAGQGTLSLSGYAQPDDINIKATAKDIKAASLPFIDLGTIPLTLQNMIAQLSGTYKAPTLNAAYQLGAARQEDLNISVTGDLSYSSNKASTTINAKGRGIKTFSGDVSLPLELSLQPFKFNMPAAAPIEGAFKGNFDIGAVAPLVVPQTYNLAGQVDLDATISGGATAPFIDASLSMTDGIFEDTLNDLYFSQITAKADFKDNTLNVSSLSAQDRSGNGNLQGSGAVNLANTSRPNINGALTLKNMELIQNEQYAVRLNAEISIETAPQNYRITGNITPQNIQINLPERFEQPIPELNIVQTKEQTNTTDTLLQKTILDIVFSAQNQIFVRGWGLDSELGGKLNVTGTAKNPLINGELESIRGRYEELGKRFDIDHARLRFQGAVPPSPYLDVKVSTDIDDITAHILMNGQATDPAIEFSSTPNLPEDEVLSRILFGEDIRRISPFQALQLARTLRRFSGKGTGADLDVLGTLRNVTGLDDIRVEGLGSEDAKVGAGKYVSDKVYLEVEQGAGENSSAASVEIELTPNVIIDSTTNQNGESDVGVFWEWKY